MLKEEIEKYLKRELNRIELKIFQAKREKNEYNLQFYLGKSVALVEFTYKFRDIKLEGEYVI